MVDSDLISKRTYFEKDRIGNKDLAIISPWSDNRGAIIDIDHFKTESIENLVNNQIHKELVIANAMPPNPLVIIDRVSFFTTALKKPNGFLTKVKVLYSEYKTGSSDHSLPVHPEKTKWISKLRGDCISTIGGMNYVEPLKITTICTAKQGKYYPFSVSAGWTVHVIFCFTVSESEFGDVPQDNFIIRA